jgi:pimeloyl-ACP methyl ester carboxylesterase
MEVVVNSLLTHYNLVTPKSAKPDAQTVLLIHGWGDSSKTFTDLMSELGEEYTTVALDLPGFGTSQSPAEVWGLEEYAAFVRDFLEKLKINNLTAVIAHSNGAAVAIKGIATGLIEPEKLIILGGAGIRDREKAKKLGLKIVAKTGKAATFWLPENKKKSLRKRLYGVSGSDMLVAPHLQETFKKTVAQDVQEDASRIQLPTLLVYGDKDAATPPLYGEIYASCMPDARLEIVPDAGHFVHHDQADKVYKLIQGFLA